MEGGHRHEEPTHSKKQLKQAKKEEEFAVRAKMKRLKEEQDARDKVWKDATVVDYHTSDYMDPLPLTGVIDQETIAKAEAAAKERQPRVTSSTSTSNYKGSCICIWRFTLLAKATTGLFFLLCFTGALYISLHWYTTGDGRGATATHYEHPL